MILSFYYGISKVDFQLIYRKRKTMEIRVEPPGEVKVIAPVGIPPDIILEKVQGKGPWIIRALESAKEIEQRAPHHEFVNGESFFYLGRRYSLSIEKDVNIKKPEVKLYHGKIIIKISSDDKKIIHQAMENWYRIKCNEKIKERIEYYKEHVGKGPYGFRVKEQKKRWGSCTSKDQLLFNWRCVMAPMWILDYIVVHEMCHLIYKNHSKEFWESVSSILPDYKERQEWLRKNGIKLDL